MARMIIPLLACLVSLNEAPALAQSSSRWSTEIREASVRFNLPARWIERVVRAESGGRTHLSGRPIVSSAGAMGLMQLMPGTWRDMQRLHGLGHDPHNPRDNILAGAAYLRAMYDAFGYPAMFAAYNAGPGRYQRSQSAGRRLPRETIAYVAAITGSPLSEVVVARTASSRILLRAAFSVPSSISPWSRSAPPAALFVPLRSSTSQ